MAENEEGKVIVDQPAFNKEVELAHLMEIVRSYLDEADCKEIMRAFEVADKAHAPQKEHPANHTSYIL